MCKRFHICVRTRLCKLLSKQFFTSVLLTTSILILLRCYVYARMHLKPSHTYLEAP